MARHYSLVPARLLFAVALLLSLILGVSTVAAATPTVTANPALVPFSEVPGQAGTTQLTFAANGTTGLTACGQDNANAPFALGAVAPNTPLVINFPYIQAGTYPFWVGTDPACGAANKLATATATRAGPNGNAGPDDIQIRFTGNFDGTPNNAEVTLSAIDQTFPIPDARICIMSGDGKQVDVAVRVGQDPRPQGLGAAAVTTTVKPFAGQNGCKPIPWIQDGAFIASIVRSGASFSLGFCSSANTPSDPPTASGIGKCAQVAFSRNPNDGPFPNGTVLLGAIVTGADNHAVQVCVSAFSPGASGTPVTQVANTVSTYSANGAALFTRLVLEFPPRTVVKVTTYDITGAGPGGANGAQFVCPTATAIQSGGGGGGITAVIVPDVPGATIIDSKNYFVF